jgi:hypothetical protein
MERMWRVGGGSKGQIWNIMQVHSLKDLMNEQKPCSKVTILGCDLLKMKNKKTVFTKMFGTQAL